MAPKLAANSPAPPDQQPEFIPEAKILRVFRCIQLLAQPAGATVAELTEALSNGPRTIYRYLHLVQALGYIIDKRAGRPGEKDRYFLFEPVADKRQLYAEELTAAEADLLQLRLADLGESGPVLTSLRHKLRLAGTPVPLPAQVRWARTARMLETLTAAIAAGRRVRLLHYHSTNTPPGRDRVVEPLELTNRLTQLSATDVETGEGRTFNIARMGGVELLDEPCRLPDTGRRPDVFGLAATADMQPLELLLTERAYQLLANEYPAAGQQCEPSGQIDWPHRFRGRIRGFEGAARFVMGLPTEVRIVAPDSFRERVRAKIALAVW